MYDRDKENNNYQKYSSRIRSYQKNFHYIRIESDEKLKQNNDQLKIEIEELNKKLKKEREENQSLNLKIKQLENEKLKMKQSLEEKENEINDAKKEKAEKKKIKSHINQQNQELENQLNQFKEKEKNYQKETEKSCQKIQQLNEEIENMKKDFKFNSTEKENLSKDPLEFYNIIGDINSMQNVNTDGWIFYMNEEGYKIIQSKDKIDRLIIGVMGNRNKGKSFILQALSGASLQTGTTINTIGISIKYLENKYVLLDCAGSESPLLGENANMLEISRDKLFTEAFL